MKRGTWMKPLAIALCFAMGVTVTPDVAGARETNTVSAAKETDKDASATEALKALINKMIVNGRASIKEPMRIVRREIGEKETQEELFVVETLAAKGGNVTCSIYDVNKDVSPELFALSGKKLSVYEYTEQMVTNGKAVKPLLSMKYVKEVRKGKSVKNSFKGTFIVKQVTKKQTVYTECTYTAGSVTKDTVYSAKGNTYKKNNKKISKAAFNKYEKSYNKKKVAEMSAAIMSREWLYGWRDRIIIDPNLCVNDVNYGGKKEGKLIVRYDTDREKEGKNPYLAFGEIYEDHPFRIVFGKDIEKDFDAYLNQSMDITKSVPLFKSILTDDPEYVVTGFREATKDQPAYYSVALNDEDGESDYFYRVTVEKVGDETKISTVDIVESTGMIPEYYEFTYGDSVWDIDGEIYSPGLDMECYPTEDFIKSGEDIKTHTLKVTYPDKTLDLKTLSYVRFVPFTSNGKFTYTVNGQKKEFTQPDIFSDEVAAINPVSGSDFTDASEALTWTAS